MKTLCLSIIVTLLVTIVGLHYVLAQNVTNSTNSMPPNAIRTPNGGWVTPLQTNQNGKNLTIHYETGIPVSGYANPGPPPIIHMTIETNSKVYEKGDMITISGKEDDYLLQKYGNDLTLSIDDTRTGDHWCCDNFKFPPDGSFSYSFKMPDMFQSSDNYNVRLSPNNSTDEYGAGFQYYIRLPNPLEQSKLGIPTLNVECRDGFVHIIKSEDKYPACVRQEDVDELAKRGWTSPVLIPSKRAPHIVPPYIEPTKRFPCETPYEEKATTTSPVYPNGTVITTGYVPVLYMPVNSTGLICVKYYNSNDPKPAGIQIFEANDLSRKANVSSSASPDTIAAGNSTVVYTISTGNKAGFYGISFFCGGTPFAVGYDNQSRIVLDDFPWLGKTFHCPIISYNFQISGFEGIGVYYIKTVTRDQLSYDIQNTTVSSYHVGSNSQNVTFSLHIHTFVKPAHFWFDYKDSTIAEFLTNPGFKQTSNPCNWDVAYNNAIQNAAWLRMDGVHLKEKPVTIPPYSNGTYTFSILTQNLSDGYYGLDPVVYGSTTDDSPDNAGTNYIAYNYPITIGTGIAWKLDSVGTCSR